MGETYYEVLEVDPDATHDEIESAYRKRVLDTHPDHSDDPDAAEQFKRVTTARSVLTDGTERARYDRLGHDAYVGRTRGSSTSDGSSEGGDGSSDGSAEPSDETDGPDPSASDSKAGQTGTQQSTAAGSETNTSEGNSKWRDAARQWANEQSDSTKTEADHTGRTRSHHARQRSKRRQKRAKKRANGNWPFETGNTSGSGGTETRQKARATTDTQDHGGFEHSVRDWDDEVDLAWNGQRFDQTTAVSVGSVALLYPLFVAGSLTTMFSLPVNAIIAVCTFVLVGYLLTMPRIAIVAFGGWSILFPLGIVQLSLIDLISIGGVLVLAFAWVPLGYAVAVWWVLRP